MARNRRAAGDGMAIRLTGKRRAFVRRRVQSGGFKSAQAYIDRLVEADRRAFERLKSDIRKGLDDLERGRYVELDEQGLRELVEKVKADGRKRLVPRRRSGAA
jgi:Arc/MetJ-type ribon-helix-helix transcriptional regulator